ncbi:hypothetical protein N665_0719s0020 [Sinapis alba]|nr:hypothetical protein N665_0719s0020 [Sinapis alba]
MDFKGIAWVGNVYHKFEAMCLEVEELIVQDTAKYVENQVQTVGNSMKKFCSDVVQDLLPDDSVVSENPLPVCLLHEYAPVCSSKKKRRESFSRKTRDVKQEQEVVTEGNIKSGCEMKLRGLDADDYDICTSSRQYRRTQPGHKQICKEGEIVRVTRPCVHQDSTSLSVVHNTRVRNDDVGSVKSSDSPPGAVARLNSKAESQKDDRTENEHGPAVNGSVRSQDSESRTENEHGLVVASSVRSQDSEIQPFIAISLPAESDEHKSEILQQLSERSVEESCIIVDRDELHCVFPDRKENDKHKPYKKIRDAISSRMKQNRENEYKRLARQWYAEDVVNGRECGDNPKQIEENQSSEESEWELL